MVTLRIFLFLSIRAGDFNSGRRQGKYFFAGLNSGAQTSQFPVSTVFQPVS
jgi:hypothetical protein